MSGPNTSHAVMSQRVEPTDSLDDFPTPPWATTAFLSELHKVKKLRRTHTCWEPASNRGLMYWPLKERFDSVRASDIHDYGCGHEIADFLDPRYDSASVDWIITNPPFRLAEDFARVALSRANRGVALLVRSVWTETIGRYERIFSEWPPTWIFQYAERVPMVRGRYDPKASTATSYAWMVWDAVAHNRTTEFCWIPPSRAEIEGKA